MGRFTGIDPVGFVDSSPISFNKYAYANNNPYRYIDPDGRKSVYFQHEIDGVTYNVHAYDAVSDFVQDHNMKGQAVSDPGKFGMSLVIVNGDSLYLSPFMAMDNGDYINRLKEDVGESISAIGNHAEKVPNVRVQVIGGVVTIVGDSIQFYYTKDKFDFAIKKGGEYVGKLWGRNKAKAFGIKSKGLSNSIENIGGDIGGFIAEEYLE